jgi:hypothetical protein
VHEILI